MAELRGETVMEEPDTIITMRASALFRGLHPRREPAARCVQGDLERCNEAELTDLADDLRDRYGVLPEPAANLLEIMGVKLIAKLARVARIDAGREVAAITFAENSGISADRVMTLLKRHKGRSNSCRNIRSRSR